MEEPLLVPKDPKIQCFFHNRNWRLAMNEMQQLRVNALHPDPWIYQNAVVF